MKGAEQMAHLGECLLYKDLTLLPQNSHFKINLSIVVHACNARLTKGNRMVLEALWLANLA